jgi:hypothetical protein
MCYLQRDLGSDYQVNISKFTFVDSLDKMVTFMNGFSSIETKDINQEIYKEFLMFAFVVYKQHYQVEATSGW